MEAKFRRFVHNAVADVSHYTGAVPLRRFIRHRLLSKEVGCVLGLHRVLKEDQVGRTNCIGGMVLREETFVLLLEYLQGRFKVVPLSKMLDAGHMPASSKPFCVLTFDDGWSDTFDTAFPWLKKYGMPATVFVTTDAVNGNNGFWIERLKRAWSDMIVLKETDRWLDGIIPKHVHTSEFREIVEWLMRMSSCDRQSLLTHLLPPHTQEIDGVDSMLTWDQVMKMSQAGIEIGAHTATHPLLTYEDDATVRHELLSSKKVLEERLHKAVRAFAYPNGDWDARVRDWVERSGYEYAVTTHPGWCTRKQDPYAISRIVIHEGNVTNSTGMFSPAMADWALNA
jgi:peptidoglycan/xylan/chitin deacetylase (PgdA/CDA1 family)